MVIDQGKLMYDGNLEQLKSDFGSGERMVVETDRIFESSQELNELGVASCSVDGKKTQLVYDKKRINSSMLIKWIMDRYDVKDFVVKETDIEEIIRTMYGERLPLEAAADRERVFV
ncbi:hypothetical protein [Paenibacillus lignilyticus]|uniref:hypothetical protein n=1 Tax=Paenibacillus lignilyticus TaxID=1172615 RepID=UPI003084360F